MVRKFLVHFMPGVIKPLRVLWNEIMAFVFLAFAAIAAPSAIRAGRAFADTGEGFLQLFLAACFILVMGGFGISSILRARRISRS